MKVKIFGYNNGENYLLVWQKQNETQCHVKELTEEQFWLPLFDNVPYQICKWLRVNGVVYGKRWGD